MKHKKNKKKLSSFKQECYGRFVSGSIVEYGDLTLPYPDTLLVDKNHLHSDVLALKDFGDDYLSAVKNDKNVVCYLRSDLVNKGSDFFNGLSKDDITGLFATWSTTLIISMLLSLLFGYWSTMRTFFFYAEFVFIILMLLVVFAVFYNITRKLKI